MRGPELLNAAADFIEANPELFNMEYFRLEQPCGTAMCVAGTLVELSGVFESPPVSHPVEAGTGRVLTWTEAATLVADLDSADDELALEELFYTFSLSPVKAVAILRGMAKGDSVSGLADDLGVELGR